MNNDQFVYWLQGMLEYRDVASLSEIDAKVLLKGIKDHLQLVFTKVTPPAPLPSPIPGIIKPLQKPAPDNKILPSIPWPSFPVNPINPNPSPHFPVVDWDYLKYPNTPSYPGRGAIC